MTPKYCTCGHLEEFHDNEPFTDCLYSEENLGDRDWCGCKKFVESLSPAEKEDRKGEDIFENNYQDNL